MIEKLILIFNLVSYAYKEKYLQLVSRFYLFTYNWYKKKILSIGICFHFGIKMFIEICFQYLIYFQLILTFLKFFICSLSIGIIMHYIDIFLIGIILVLILPLCWWLTKRGRSIWVYMHVLYASKNIVCFLLVCFLLISRALPMFYFWYQCFISRTLFYACLCIFMFNIHCIYLLFIAMHELRGSFFEA